MKSFFYKKILLTVCSLFQLLAFSQVTEVASVGITVKDMDRSVKFYTEALGFRKISDKEMAGAYYENIQGLFGIRMRVVEMQLGKEKIELIDYLTTGGRSIPEDQKSNDLFFQHIAIVVSDMEKAYQHLRKFNVEHVSTGPQTLPQSNKAAAGIKAFYFHDPDNHNLELIWFPNGKGNPKWQQSGQQIFLGIDHTAIGVSSTENSLKFYRDILGFAVKGESWNYGTEQEHLNNVEGASLHISGLGASSGPGVEFLQYLQPGPGRPYPADSRSDDLWHWQTTLFVKNIDELHKKLSDAGYSFVSKSMAENKTGQTYSKSFIVRDADGHAMLLIEKL